MFRAHGLEREGHEASGFVPFFAIDRQRGRRENATSATAREGMCDQYHS